MSSIKSFQSNKIRSTWNDEEEQWYFSILLRGLSQEA